MHGDRVSAPKGQSGFTLIEVLLVVAILGILAAVVVVNVGGRREQAMVGACRTSISGLGGAIDLYEVDTGRYPASLQALVTDDGAPNWSGPYIKGGIPSDPWGGEYRYSPKGGSSYEIRAGGADLQFGTDDDITSF